MHEASWHASGAVQVLGVPVHVPDWQLSPVVQALPSLHTVPFVFGGYEQTPVAGLQLPGNWHCPGGEQRSSSPTQTPAWHTSEPVQKLPSLQAVPFGAFGFEHVPVAGLHVPATWQASLAVHGTGFAPTHTPD